MLEKVAHKLCMAPISPAVLPGFFNRPLFCQNFKNILVKNGRLSNMGHYAGGVGVIKVMVNSMPKSAKNCP